MRRLLLALVLSLSFALAAAGAPAVGAAPASTGTVVVQLDNPLPNEQNMSPNWIAGWALDTAAFSGTGITSVTVYVDGDMTTGRLLGQARYGGDRPDVAAQYGNPAFRFSGFVFELAGTNISVGPTHSFTVVAQSAASGMATATASGVTLAPWANPVLWQPTPYAAPYGSPYGPQTGSVGTSYYGNGYGYSTPYYSYSMPYYANGLGYYGNGYGSGYSTPYYANGYGYYGNGYGYSTPYYSYSTPYYANGYGYGYSTPYYGSGLGFGAGYYGYGYGFGYPWYYGSGLRYYR